MSTQGVTHRGTADQPDTTLGRESPTLPQATGYTHSATLWPYFDVFVSLYVKSDQWEGAVHIPSKAAYTLPPHSDTNSIPCEGCASCLSECRDSGIRNPVNWPVVRQRGVSFIRRNAI